MYNIYLWTGKSRERKEKYSNGDYNNKIARGKQNVDRNAKNRRKKTLRELMWTCDEHHICADNRHINFNNFDSLIEWIIDLKATNKS